jgi:uronate dehydrogenase
MRILLTGASGRLGPGLRQRLEAAGHDIVATDLRPDPGGAPVELARLDDLDALLVLAAGVDAIVHLGGASNEAPWQTILGANIEGTYHVFEAARRCGVKRVILASTYHVVGMYPVDAAPLDLTAPPRPDSLYAVSKLFGENLAQLYCDKFGIECLAIRICAASGANTSRDLSLWLAPEDLAGLVLAGLAAETLGCRTIFGLSGSAKPWMANQPDPGLDWQPSRHSGELTPPDGATQWPPADPANSRIGAGFARRGHPDDEA